MRPWPRWLRHCTFNAGFVRCTRVRVPSGVDSRINSLARSGYCTPKMVTKKLINISAGVVLMDLAYEISTLKVPVRVWSSAQVLPIFSWKGYVVVVQLGEYFLGMEEVTGSNPVFNSIMRGSYNGIMRHCQCRDGSSILLLRSKRNANGSLMINYRILAGKGGKHPVNRMV